MIGPRVWLGLSVLALSVSGQTVISTHSGIVYFFEGSVYLGGERLEQKFGKFPDIGEGRELRTEQGRAEVLLTPGVFLRIGDTSSIKMISERLDDTRVELLSGSAILEVNESTPNTQVTLIYKQWQVKAPKQGVYRIDADPAQLHVYRGEADVTSEAKADPVVVKDGEKLALAQVLVPEQTTSLEPDNLKSWAMNRSQEVSADNQIASEIQDDPAQMDPLDPALAGYTYFPMTGVPSLGITNPYGVSFWSPYQASLASMYFSPYLYGIYPGWPSTYMIYRPTILPYRGIGGIGSTRIGSTGIGVRPGGMIGTPRIPNIPRTPTIVRPTVVRPTVAAPRAVGHR
jgi:hypothetical protein